MLDPGVLISGLISQNGAPRALLHHWLAGMFEMLACPALLDELERVLLREKFRKYVKAVEAAAFVVLVRGFAELRPDPAPVPGLTPGPGDDYLRALAQKGSAHFLVSGDLHLTRLKRPGPEVLTPRTFLRLLERS